MISNDAVAAARVVRALRSVITDIERCLERRDFGMNMKERAALLEALARQLQEEIANRQARELVRAAIERARTAG